MLMRGSSNILLGFSSNLCKRERLVLAARDGDLQEAKSLLDYNPRLVRYSIFGVCNSPLHYSAAHGHNEVVSLLLESGVDINLRNYRGQTALMQASQYGHWEVVQTLILYKASIHRTYYLNGATALHLTALNGHSQCIRLLFADYVPSIPNFCSISSKRSKNDKSVPDFDEGALYGVINRPADGGVKSLHMAALNGHVETVHLLVDLGASVTDFTLEDGTTIDLIVANEIPSAPLAQFRDQVTNVCIDILYSYSKFCATISSFGQLILLEAFKLLPLYVMVKFLLIEEHGNTINPKFLKWNTINPKFCWYWCTTSIDGSTCHLIFHCGNAVCWVCVEFLARFFTNYQSTQCTPIISLVQ